MLIVKCANCQHFTPDKIGGGDGIGQCKEIETYKMKKPSPTALEKAHKATGGKCCYPNRLRRCVKFKDVNYKLEAKKNA
jgi:hypothetical protein